MTSNALVTPAAAKDYCCCNLRLCLVTCALEPPTDNVDVSVIIVVL